MSKTATHPKIVDDVPAAACRAAFRSEKGYRTSCFVKNGSGTRISDQVVRPASLCAGRVFVVRPEERAISVAGAAGAIEVE